MIVKKTWFGGHTEKYTDILGREQIASEYVYTGWFLFGIIPLYIIRA